MLLRDLDWKQRDPVHHYWDYCKVHLGDKSRLHIERTTALHPKWPSGQYDIYRRLTTGLTTALTHRHEYMQEFEAQCVLDHYIATYGLLPEVIDAAS